MLSREDKNKLIRYILLCLQKNNSNLFNYLVDEYKIVFNNLNEFIEDKNKMVGEGKEDILLMQLLSIRLYQLEEIAESLT